MFKALSIPRDQNYHRRNGEILVLKTAHSDSEAGTSQYPDIFKNNWPFQGAPSSSGGLPGIEHPDAHYGASHRPVHRCGRELLARVWGRADCVILKPTSDFASATVSLRAVCLMHSHVQIHVQCEWKTWLERKRP